MALLLPRSLFAVVREWPNRGESDDVYDIQKYAWRWTAVSDMKYTQLRILLAFRDLPVQTSTVSSCRRLVIPYTVLRFAYCEYDSSNAAESSKLKHVDQVEQWRPSTKDKGSQHVCTALTTHWALNTFQTRPKLQGATSLYRPNAHAPGLPRL
jgi:hypothetical protein